MTSSVTQPAGNFYDKYNTRNPIARALMQGFLRAFEELVDLAGPVADVVEIGCGEAELSMRMARAGWRVTGCDIAPEAVEESRRRIEVAGLPIPVSVCDIAQAPENFQPAHLVVCCEVLEHLDDPAQALDILSGLSTRYVLVSVPREPIWRVLNMVRGRYLAQMGNTPGHVQHWSRRRFLALLQTKLDVVAIRAPLPWTMVLCSVRDA
jgi:2-polyprenyl-3-methyl-5-hydroxy-6-metoxy-1,4-benzoquinol methylase